MRLLHQPHRFYCGIDLHARTLYLHVLDHDGQTRFDKNIPAQPAAFLEAVEPFRDGLVVGVECMFAWYWLADLCDDEGIPFVLGHALAMKAIHGGKAKNDKIDAHKIAGLLRGGLFPQAYVYPKAIRETRDLLRRRILLGPHNAPSHRPTSQNTNSQYNLPPFGKKLELQRQSRNIDEIVDRFPHQSVRHSVRADLAMIDALDAQVDSLESYLTRAAKIDDPVTYHLLRTVPGIGKVIALILLYEVQDIRRFEHAGNFLSYSRLVRCRHESAGKIKGSGCTKIGNAHLRWAFCEAACLMLRCHEPAKRWLQRKTTKCGSKAKALGILAAEIARAVYYVWRKQQPFDPKKFLTS